MKFALLSSLLLVYLSAIHAQVISSRQNVTIAANSTGVQWTALLTPASSNAFALTFSVRTALEASIVLGASASNDVSGYKVLLGSFGNRYSSYFRSIRVIFLILIYL